MPFYSPIFPSGVRCGLYQDHPGPFLPFSGYVLAFAIAASPHLPFLCSHFGSAKRGGTYSNVGS